MKKILHYIKLYAGTTSALVLLIVALLTGSIAVLITAIPAVMVLGWIAHTTLFASKAECKLCAIEGMMWLLPSYLLQSFKYIGMVIYPLTVPFKGWAYLTLGQKVDVLYKTHGGAVQSDVDNLRRLKFTTKEQVARVLHWFWEDEEYRSEAHKAGTVYKGDWVVNKVLPHKDVGEAITKFEEILINLYWEGNRNIMANMYCELDSKIGGTRQEDFKEVEYSRTDEVSTTSGIGPRTRGYSHTQMKIGLRVYPQFTYVSDKVFASAGYGSSTGKFSPRVIERFEANMRFVTK